VGCAEQATVGSTPIRSRLLKAQFRLLANGLSMFAAC